MFVARSVLAGAVVAGLVWFATGTNAALYTDPKHLPTDTYDFIVVGAGAAGNVIASRLTENPKFTVLVIEAGISNEGLLNIEVPLLASRNLDFTNVTWNYTTAPQTSLNNRTIAYSRGRVLGGCSSINFMAYTRGSNDEYDKWAELTEDDSWAWKNLAPYYFKSSRLTPPSDNHNTTGEVDPRDHGFGPIQTCRSARSQLDSRILATTNISSSEFPFNLDIQSGNSVGIGLLQSTIGNGTRSSSATAYLQPALHKPNLHVLIQNTVTRLIQSGHDGGAPAFKKVEFAASPNSPRTVVTAKKEVILSSGSIGTPQILLLSGIGDSKHLRTLGIKPIVNLPDVGQHLTDHPILANFWLVNSTHTLDDTFRDPALAAAALAQWQQNRSGVYSNTLSFGIGFLRIPDNASVFQTTPDPAAGPRSGHFEMLVRNGFGSNDVATLPPTGHYVTINVVVVTPTSRGSVRLASTDPFAFPIIDPNFFNTSFDQFVMLSAVKAARAFMDAAPWQDFAPQRFGAVGSAQSDEDIIAAARDNIVTIWHPTSTARMSPRNASWGVVDSQLRVKGVSGLRIVDASVFPLIPAVHTVAPTYILAERAADIIKAAWG